MNKKIKKMLIEKSNSQEIHDLSQKILSDVNPSRVMLREPKRHHFGLRMAGLASCFALALVVITGISLNKPESGPKGNTVSMTDEVVLETYAYQAYALGSVALRQDVSNISTTSSNLLVEEEETLVDDLDKYMGTIEELFGIVKFEYLVEENKNNVYNYENVLTVTCDGETNYNLFYTETIINISYEDEPEYRYDSSLEGSLEIGTKRYDVTGYKVVKENTYEFEMQIELLNNTYLEINQDFGVSRDKYNYKYYTDTKLTKQIDIELLSTRSGETRIQFKNEIRSLELSYDGTTIIVKIKSSNGDYVYITKKEDKYEFEFLNSGHKYEKIK